MVVVSSLSCVWLFVNPWTVAHRLLCPWISQARILEWVAISFSRGSSWVRAGTHISCTAGRFITAEPPGKPKKSIKSLQKKHESNCWGDLSGMGSGSPVALRPRDRTSLHLNHGHSHLLCNLGWVSKSIKVWVLSAASEPFFLNSKGSEWAQRQAASHQLLQPCTVKSRFLKLIRSFWTKGDTEVETGQMDGKNPKQDRKPEDAKYDPPVLSIMRHSLGSGGIASYPHRCEELTHWKRPWCWERLKAGEGYDRGWDGRMASLAWWTWVWVSSGSWWWTGRPDVHGVTESWTWLHDWTELSYPHLSANTCLISCNFPHSSMMQYDCHFYPRSKETVD